MIVIVGIDLKSSMMLLCVALGGITMINLKTEYTDIKDVKHHVEHFTVPADDKNSRERIVEDLLNALTRQGKPTPAS